MNIKFKSRSEVLTNLKPILAVLKFCFITFGTLWIIASLIFAILFVFQEPMGLTPHTLHDLSIIQLLMVTTGISAPMTMVGYWIKNNFIEKIELF